MNSLKALALSICFTISLSACSDKQKLKAVKVTHTRVESTVSTTSSGTVEAEQQAVLGFGNAGRVSRVLVQVGQSVNKGALIAEQENLDLKSIFSDAQKELDRTKKLSEEGLVSAAALDQAKKAYDVARSNLERSQIIAPFEGMITELNLQIGELFQIQTTAGKSPVRIVDKKPRRIKGEVDELDLGKVQVGNTAKVKIQAVRTLPFDAKVDKVIPFVSTTKEQDRTAQVELIITGTSQIIPVGASADIEIVSQFKNDALAIPTQTLLGNAQNRYVYTATDGKLKKVTVKIGIGNYERTEILEGLNKDDVVIYPSDTSDIQEGSKAVADVTPWPSSK